MTQTHPLTPPEELLEGWYWTGKSGNWQNAFTLAYRAGADQELKAVEEEIIAQGWFANSVHRRAQLRAARRPKPPRLKEQALAALEDDDIDVYLIRRALEALDD